LTVEAFGIGEPAGQTVRNAGMLELTEVTLTIAAVALAGTGPTPATPMSTL